MHKYHNAEISPNQFRLGEFELKPEIAESYFSAKLLPKNWEEREKLLQELIAKKETATNEFDKKFLSKIIRTLKLSLRQKHKITDTGIARNPNAYKNTLSYIIYGKPTADFTAEEWQKYNSLRLKLYHEKTKKQFADNLVPTIYQKYFAKNREPFFDERAYRLFLQYRLKYLKK